jgi:hypothetical protein
MVSPVKPVQSPDAAPRRISRKKLVIGLLLSFAGLSGCAVPPPMFLPMAQIHRVGVVSVTAVALTERTVGNTEFEYRSQVQDISAWGVDRAYEDQLAVAVESTLGATAVRAPTVPPELLSMNDPSTPYIQPEFWAYRADPLAASIRGYCTRNQIDTLLVASTSLDDDVLSGTYHPLSGAGVTEHAGNHLLHLSAALTLIDCETGRPLERRRVASGRSFEASHGYPVKGIPDGIGTASVASGSAADRERIRQALIALPAKAWEDTVRGMLPREGPPVFGRTMLPNT